jgi:hypothetical protein
VITPNHFLLGGKSSEPIIPDLLPFGKRWFHMQEALDSFWSRFVKEIQPSLQTVNKWFRNMGEIKMGDLVLSLEKSERGLWPIGRVQSLETGKDGLERAALIKIGDKVYRRSLKNLGILRGINEAADPSINGPEQPQTQ